MRIVTALALFFGVVPLVGREGMAADEWSTPGLQHGIARWMRPSIGARVKAEIRSHVHYFHATRLPFLGLIASD